MCATRSVEPATAPGFRANHLARRGFASSLWRLAWQDDELVGFALAYPEHLGDPSLGWIDSLGVRPRWRQRGFGRALLLGAFDRLHTRGLRRVQLGVDGGNEAGALRLYERCGMRVVRRADNWMLEVERRRSG